MAGRSGRPGRPRKLTGPTGPIWQAIVEALRTTGCSEAEAARFVEVDEETFRRWKVNDEGFRGAVEKAINDFHMGYKARVRATATRDPRTLLWMGEHHPRLRAEWASNARLTVEGGAQPVRIEVDHRGEPVHVEPRERFLKLAACLDVMQRVGLIGPPPAIGPPLAPRLVNPQPNGEEPA